MRKSTERSPFVEDYYNLCVAFYNGNFFSAGMTGVATAAFVLAIENQDITNTMRAVIMVFLIMGVITTLHFMVHLSLMYDRMLEEVKYKDKNHPIHGIVFSNRALMAFILICLLVISALITAHMF